MNTFRVHLKQHQEISESLQDSFPNFFHYYRTTSVKSNDDKDSIVMNSMPASGNSLNNNTEVNNVDECTKQCLEITFPVEDFKVDHEFILCEKYEIFCFNSSLKKLRNKSSIVTRVSLMNDYDENLKNSLEYFYISPSVVYAKEGSNSFLFEKKQLNLLNQFLVDFAGTGGNMSDFKKLCYDYKGKKDSWGFDLLLHMIRRSWKEESKFLISVVNYETKMLPYEDLNEGWVNDIIQSELKDKVIKNLDQLLYVFKGKTGYSEFITKETKRLSEIKHLGVGTKEKSVTRLLYLSNFVDVISIMLGVDNKTLGIKRNTDVNLLEKSGEEYIKTKTKIKISNYEVLLCWFIIFNFGHMKDERAAERVVVYKLWKDLVDNNQKKNPTNSKELLLQPNEEQSNPSEIKEKRVGPNSNLTRLRIPKNTIVDEQCSTPVPKDFTSPQSLEKYRDCMEINESCKRFMVAFPEHSKKKASAIIASGDWAYFYRVLSVWRLINTYEGLTDDCRLLLLSLAELFFKLSSTNSNTLIRTFYILRQIVYLMTDPP
ncbi:hypothetical protein ABK040_013663, partial [Willaertia magna]